MFKSLFFWDQPRFFTLATCKTIVYFHSQTSVFHHFWRLNPIWGCPEMGVPPNHPNFSGIFHYKPSIFGYHGHGKLHFLLGFVPVFIIFRGPFLHVMFPKIEDLLWYFAQLEPLLQEESMLLMPCNTGDDHCHFIANLWSGNSQIWICFFFGDICRFAWCGLREYSQESSVTVGATRGFCTCSLTPTQDMYVEVRTRV